MGNCQAAEAATVLIYHPREKIQRIYWSVSAHEVMSSNPGHYVALVVNSPTMKSVNGTPLKQLRLLRREDTLLIGHAYRLVSFEDVLKELSAKKGGMLVELLKENGGFGMDMKMKNPSSNKSKLTPTPQNSTQGNDGQRRGSGRRRGISGGSGGGSGSGSGSGGQWRPALRSIDED